MKSHLLKLPFVDQIEKAALVGNSRLLVAGTNWAHASMWDMHNGQRLFELIDPVPNPHQRGIVNMLRNSIGEVALRPDGTLVSGRSRQTGKLALYRAEDGRSWATSGSKSRAITDLTVCSHFRATGSMSSKAFLLNVASF